MISKDHQPTPSRSLEVAIEDAIRRLKAAWPGYRWPEDYEREHRDSLAWLNDPAVIDEAITNIIRGTSERYPPPIGAVAAAAREITDRRKGSSDWSRGNTRVEWIEAHPHPRDQPGTVRWIAVYEDGTRYPPNARAAGE